MTILNWAKSHINYLISLALAAAIILIALRQGGELIAALRHVKSDWAFAGLACYAVNYLLRAIRISIVLKKRIPVWPDSIHAACLHGLATYLLPFRSGDFTLPMILNKTSNLDFSKGAGVLITVRLLDLCALGVWILAAAVLIQFSLPGLLHAAWVLFGAVLLLLPFLLRRALLVGKRIRGRVWQRILQWGEATTAFDFYAFLVSVGIWACVGACFYCTVNAIRLPLSYVDVWLLITIQLPLQMIPLQGVANAGNHEGGWVAGLALLGISTDQGLHYALLSHALILAYVLALGPSAFFIRSSRCKRYPAKV